MSRNLGALLSGTLFGLGLSLSRMVDPAVVAGFLDVTGHWDPRLLLVMGAALAVSLPGFHLALKYRERPIFDERFHLPARKVVDGPLVLGGALFGVGWGLGGICPGPAVTDLAFGRMEPAIFLVGMLAGMGLQALWQRRVAMAHAGPVA